MLSSHLRLDFPEGLFPSGLPTKSVYAFLDSYISAHYSRLDLSIMQLFPFSCNLVPQLAPNIFLEILLLNTLNFGSSLDVGDHVSQSYNKTGNITIVYVLTFSFILENSEVYNNMHFLLKISLTDQSRQNPGPA